MGMTIIEAADYVRAYDLDGISLTESGRGAAESILAHREAWTSTHALMLERIRGGMDKLPHRLVKLVARTRLGDALALARDMTKGSLRKEKCKARRKAARERRKAAMAA